MNSILTDILRYRTTLKAEDTRAISTILEAMREASPMNGGGHRVKRRKKELLDNLTGKELIEYITRNLMLRYMSPYCVVPN
jgi:hypothetical protein